MAAWNTLEMTVCLLMRCLIAYAVNELTEIAVSNYDGGGEEKMPGAGFVMQGVKRIVDHRAVYAQLVVTDDCNLSCGYCTEYIPGAPPVPFDTVRSRIDKLDDLGVMVYDVLGGEPLMHPQLAGIIRHIKSKRRGANMVILITNGFLLTERHVSALNDAGLDLMQISVDSITPTASSHKALKTVLPKLHMLAAKAGFHVKVQSVLTPQTAKQYDEFRHLLADLPFDFSFSLLHEPGGHVAIQGDEYVQLLTQHNLFAGMQLYRQHAEEMLLGDDSRPWKCLGGSKFLYVNAAGQVQFCSQNAEFQKPLSEMTVRDLRANHRHKMCEPGCALGCARLVSHALGEPLKTLQTSLSLVSRIWSGKPEKVSTQAAVPTRT
jgi:MoaA/NifB/PqqE/SkfB family radical SAM enzyme